MTRTARRVRDVPSVRRPALRAALAAVLAGPVLWLAAPGGAHAHGGGLQVDITGQSFGHVAATVTWADDGDPVDERVAATVNAVSGDGGTALGPWRLVRAPGTPAGYTTAEALPPGRWKVTVEVGHPALGRAEGDITVSPGTPASPSAGAGPTGSGASPEPAGPGTSAPATGPADSGTGPGTDSGSGSAAASPPVADSAARDGGTSVPVVVAAATAVAAVCATGLALARRARAAKSARANGR
ncbi:hypothetical protein [Streptomyces sp. TRM49041]|uniref:hypothetical protein n=1 Tax=Streptomyces sp. TRM49041 TaxID=2603216 RepID=UPI0011EE70A0|nr:hypothetical protein [Streptomyces sp. TRM49041]